MQPPPSTKHADGQPLTPLQAAAAEYIARRGMPAFMDEDYNLTGTRVRAVVTDDNLNLALAFGVPVPAAGVPVAVDKTEILAALSNGRGAANRAELAAFFADPASVPELSDGQRMFMEWHYLSPLNYQFTLEKELRGEPGAARILGWNRETHEGGQDFVFYTGLLGCTGICAIAEDGTAYMSHWDEICNPRQVEGYSRFAINHPGGRVHIVGVLSQVLGEELRKHFPDLEILYHVKKIYFERTYTVRFTRINGQVAISIYEADVTDDYVSSTHNGEYGRWFPHGRFGQAYPGGDDEFLPCTFERLA